MNNFIHFCDMSLPIGQKIKAKIKEKGWSVKRFAAESNMSYRNAMSLFLRTDVGVEHLYQISKVLDYNFFKDYTIPSDKDEKNVITENKSDYQLVPKDYTTMVFSLTIAGDSYTFERFPELIKRVRKNADDLGFKIL